MDVKVPTIEEFRAYTGAHTHRLWLEVGEFWVCPACKRSKFQILRWTARFPSSPRKFKDWVAPLHKHHDHSAGIFHTQVPRFAPTIICDQCNSADGTAKRKLKLPNDFSFSPDEIARFVIARPHDKHSINSEIALSIFKYVCARYNLPTEP